LLPRARQHLFMILRASTALLGPRALATSTEASWMLVSLARAQLHQRLRLVCSMASRRFCPPAPRAKMAWPMILGCQPKRPAPMEATQIIYGYCYRPRCSPPSLDVLSPKFDNQVMCGAC